jgi:hypothetical protein
MNGKGKKNCHAFLLALAVLFVLFRPAFLVVVETQGAY